MMANEILPEKWTMIDTTTLECPHGYLIELDGKCPEGCESPLKKGGMI